MSENIINLTNENYQGIINGSNPVLVDFWATWCGPCRMVGPVIENLADEYAGKAAVCKVNVDDMPDLASQYKIMSIPTVMVIKNGEILDKAVGVRTKEEYQGMIEKII